MEFDDNRTEFCLFCYYQKLGFRQSSDHPGFATRDPQPSAEETIRIDKNTTVAQLEMDANPDTLIKHLKTEITRDWGKL